MRRLWENNEIQFARLLSEIVAVQADLDIPAIAESMDLDIEYVDELFDRAHEVWERSKRRIRRS